MSVTTPETSTGVAPGATVSIVQEESQPLSLCQACQTCLIEPIVNDNDDWVIKRQVGAQFDVSKYFWYHHISHRSWQDAIKNGCYICNFLQECAPTDFLALLCRDECREIYRGTARLFVWEVAIPPDQRPIEIHIKTCIKPELLLNTSIYRVKYLLREDGESKSLFGNQYH